VIIEGGLAVGIILGQLGSKIVETDVHFNCSWILLLMEIILRIHAITEGMSRFQPLLICKLGARESVTILKRLERGGRGSRILPGKIAIAKEWGNGGS